MQCVVNIELQNGWYILVITVMAKNWLQIDLWISYKSDVAIVVEARRISNWASHFAVLSSWVFHNCYMFIIIHLYSYSSTLMWALVISAIFQMADSGCHHSILRIFVFLWRAKFCPFIIWKLPFSYILERRIGVEDRSQHFLAGLWPHHRSSICRSV